MITTKNDIIKNEVMTDTEKITGINTMAGLPFYFSQDINDKVANSLDFSKFILECLSKHFANDFSECSKEDAELNKQALIDGGRIFNVFYYRNKEKIWIITEAEPHRDITTILFPHEY